MDIRGDRPSVTIPVCPKDVILFHWIREGDYRSLSTAPIIVHGINILDVMTEWIDVDQIVAGIIFENVVMDLDAG
jgi:hypothetical protein